MNKQEHELQVACVKWFKETYPFFSMALFSIPNGGSRHILEAINLKKEGMTKGVADLFLAIPNKENHGVFIEMKAAKGKPSEEQKQFLALMHKLNYKVAIVRTFQTFVKIVQEQLGSK